MRFSKNITMAAREEIEFEALSIAIEEPYGRARQLALRMFCFPVAYLLFGVVGTITSLGCWILALVLPAKVGRPLGQQLIQRLFAFFLWYLEQTGLAQFDFHDLAKMRDWRGGIIVANHPCLIDAVLLISRLPRVFCLMKQDVLSNLVLCGTARLAGYVDNHSAKQMVKTCAARIQEGETLVIFPEGTRTVRPAVNSFKMGFALVAQFAQAPIQTVFIETSSPYLGKHWPFLKPPPLFPLRYSLKLGQCFHPHEGSGPKSTGKLVEDYYVANLPPPIWTGNRMS